MLVNSWNSGVTRATPGNIDAPRMKPSTRNLPGNCSRANAYAAKTPTISAKAVTTTPMPTLLSSARPKWLPRSVLNAVLKLSSVTCVGQKLVSKV
jgi:hypothetical protein